MDLHVFQMLGEGYSRIAGILIGTIVLAVISLLGAAVIGFFAHQKKTAQPAYTELLDTGSCITGTVTRVRISAGQTDFAILYRYQDTLLTALFAIQPEMPVQPEKGQRVKLRVFADALLETKPDAQHRAQHALGALPEDAVQSRSVHGIPLDETATVMLETDYPTFEAVVIREYYAKDHKTAPNIMLAVAAVLGVCGGAILLFFCTL